MARRRRSNRRRRRGRFSFLYKLLSVLLICGAIIGAVTFLFRIDQIEITGVSHYSEQDILTAAGVQTGDNMYLLNKYDVQADIFKDLPYVQTVQINRRLPSILTIHITECQAAGAITQDGAAWLVSGSGKILEQLTAADAAAYPVIDGCTLLAPSVGTTIAMGQENELMERQLLSLLSSLESRDMLKEMQSIHLGESAYITMEYAGRFAVRFAWDADFDYKLQNLEVVISKLEVNETGVIDLTRDGVANFIPY